jgi:hypothetical protein
MQHRTLEQIATDADILAPPTLSRQARLKRWADLLERQAGHLRPIPEIEFGPRAERDARRADGSPLAVAYTDPMLRAAGLQGDRVGDAAEFFGLSHWQLHHLVCSCHHGRTVERLPMAAHLRGLARRPKALTLGTWSRELTVGVGAAAALTLLAIL